MTKTLLLLANGFEIFEASVFFDVLGWNLIEGDGSTKVVTCALSKNVKSTFGATMIADITADELQIEEYDALAVPGGFSEFGFYNDAYNTTFLDIIRGFQGRNKIVASICTGAMPIGKSGILNGLNGTTYNLGGIRQKQLADLGVTVINQPIVEDNNIITSWNPSTAVDVAFLLLERLTTADNAANVRRLMGF